MFNLITHEVNNERSDYLYTHFLLETNGSAPFFDEMNLKFSRNYSILKLIGHELKELKKWKPHSMKTALLAYS